MAEAKKQRVIDDNMHFLPTDLFTNEKVLNGFLYSAPITMGVKAYLDKTPDGTKNQVVLATDSGEEILNYVEGDYTLETKIQAMDDAGVDIAMLRMPVWQEWLPLEICKIVNDQAAEMCKRSEGRLVANAVVPPYGRPEDIAEVRLRLWQQVPGRRAVRAHDEGPQRDEAPGCRAPHPRPELLPELRRVHHHAS